MEQSDGTNGYGTSHLHTSTLTLKGSTVLMHHKLYPTCYIVHSMSQSQTTGEPTAGVSKLEYYEYFERFHDDYGMTVTHDECAPRRPTPPSTSKHLSIPAAASQRVSTSSSSSSSSSSARPPALIWQVPAHPSTLPNMAGTSASSSSSRARP